MTIHDNGNLFINFAATITVVGGAILLFILICRRYLYAIFEHVDGLLTVDNCKNLRIFHVPTKARLFYINKRIFDLIISSLLLINLWPLMLFAAILVKVDSHGRIFYKQKRIGKKGKIFYAYKFRTIAVGFLEDKCLKEIGLRVKLNADPRVTRVGKFLRKTSLDELPKLINVLKGDMSIVGTSEATDYSYIESLSSEVVDAILSVKPGLVSLWSLSGSRMRWDLDSRLAYDLYYVSHQSFILDLSIFLMTPFSVLGRAGYEGGIEQKEKNRKQKTGNRE